MGLTTKNQEMNMLLQNIKEWLRYSQVTATIISKRMTELGLTQRIPAEKKDCTLQWQQEYVVGNLMQDRMHLNIEITKVFSN